MRAVVQDKYLCETAEAIRYVGDGHTRGTVVVTVSTTSNSQEA